MQHRAFSPSRLMLAVALAAALSGSALAAGTDSMRIGELEKRLENLQQQVSDLTVARSTKSEDEGLPLHGFADIGGIRSNADNSVDGKHKRGFTIGSLDFYLSPQLGGHVKTLLELVFEVEADGGIATDLERAQIGYTFSDSLTAWAGRFHTPYGYWNTAFHHGQQIQTSVTRPRFLDFEDKGGILPAHSVGAWFTGAQSLAGNKLGYDVYVSNSPSIAIDTTVLGNTVGTLDMKMAGAEKHDPAVGFILSFRPGAVPDLTVGLHGHRGKVSDTNLMPNQTRLNMAGGYAVFNDDSLELMTEYYRFRNQDLSGATGSHTSSAWYAQAGYAVAGYTPYARYEKAELDQADNYFAAQASGRSYRRSVAGVRYDINPKAAIKLELNRTRQADLAPLADDNYSEARFQVAVRF
jgi:hypothetical protein